MSNRTICFLAFHTSGLRHWLILSRFDVISGGDACLCKLRKYLCIIDFRNCVVVQIQAFDLKYFISARKTGTYKVLYIKI